MGLGLCVLFGRTSSFLSLASKSSGFRGLGFQVAQARTPKPQTPNHGLTHVQDLPGVDGGGQVEEEKGEILLGFGIRM